MLHPAMMARVQRRRRILTDSSQADNHPPLPKNSSRQQESSLPSPLHKVNSTYVPDDESEKWPSDLISQSQLCPRPTDPKPARRSQVM